MFIGSDRSGLPLNLMIGTDRLNHNLLRLTACATTAKGVPQQRAAAGDDGESAEQFYTECHNICPFVHRTIDVPIRQVNDIAVTLVTACGERMGLSGGTLAPNGRG